MKLFCILLLGSITSWGLYQVSKDRKNGNKNTYSVQRETFFAENRSSDELQELNETVDVDGCDVVFQISCVHFSKKT